MLKHPKKEKQIFCKYFSVVVLVKQLQNMKKRVFIYKCQDLDWAEFCKSLLVTTSALRGNNVPYLIVIRSVVLFETSGQL